LYHTPFLLPPYLLLPANNRAIIPRRLRGIGRREKKLVEQKLASQISLTLWKFKKKASCEILTFVLKQTLPEGY